LASLREIRRRIKSVKNIAQVTQAMQMVAASRMKKAQEQALASRPYAERTFEILHHLADQSKSVKNLHPLLVERPVKNVGILLITADKGLAGAYNSNIIRATMRFNKSTKQPTAYITVGKKGFDLMNRFNNKVIADFVNYLPDRPGLIDIIPIAEMVMDSFLNGVVDEVYLAYTKFVNTVVQTPRVDRLLPFEPSEPFKITIEHESLQKKTLASVYEYEPDPETVLDVVLPRFIRSLVYQAVLESIASEHSARMVAMRNATDNAHELIDTLNLTYNRARQESITKEILDIVGGVEALGKN